MKYLNFLKKSIFLKNNFYLKISNRNLFIKKNWVGFKFAVYNGKYFIPLQIKENMVGKMLGSFIFTKKILLKTTKKIFIKKKRK